MKTLQDIGMPSEKLSGLTEEQIDYLDCIAWDICGIVDDFCLDPMIGGNDRYSIKTSVHREFLYDAEENGLTDVLDDVIDLVINKYEAWLFHDWADGEEWI